MKLTLSELDSNQIEEIGKHLFEAEEEILGLPLDNSLAWENLDTEDQEMYKAEAKAVFMKIQEMLAGNEIKLEKLVRNQNV